MSVFGLIICGAYDDKTIVKFLCKKIWFFNEEVTIEIDDFDSLDLDEFDEEEYSVDYDFHEDIIAPKHIRDDDWVHRLCSATFKYKELEIKRVNDVYMIILADSEVNPIISQEKWNNFETFRRNLLTNNRITEDAKMGIINEN